MKDNTKCFKISNIDINKIRSTAKNIIYINIMCFMNMIMNTFRRELS